MIQSVFSVSCDSLYSPVCLSDLRRSGLSYDHTSLLDLRRVVDFPVRSAFGYCRDRVATSKLLTTCQTRAGSPQIIPI